MSDSLLLAQTADVLEKLASYFETVESRKIAEDRAQRTKAATDLATKLGEVTGEHIDTHIVEKLSQLDPEVSKFISKIAGEDSKVESMGGPREKTASGSGPNAGDRFIEWVTGP